MASSTPMTNAEAAQLIARRLGPVLPLCYADDLGACACGGRWDDDAKVMVPHTGKEIGKAPIGKLVRTGVLEATTNSATIDRWWRAHPNAGVGLALAPSKVVFIDPDSTGAYAEAIAQGVAGGMLRSSRNDGYLFKRPADCPVLNISKSADHTDLEIRADGYAVVWAVHQNGDLVRIDPDQKLQDAPSWVVERLNRKAAEKATQDAVRAARRAERAAGGTGAEPPVRLTTRNMRRWTGELVQTKPNGDVDQSDSLYFIGLGLAEGNASEAAIRAAVEERDATLGWNKYTDRSDADERYQEIAEKTVAYVVKREQQPDRQAAPKAPDGSLDEVIAFAEATAAENLRLRRVIQDQGDRLEILEPIVTMIDEIIARPEIEHDADGNVVAYGPTSDDKLVDITIARWMPHWRARKAANGEQPGVSLGYLSKVMGMAPRRISKSLERQSGPADSGAPFQKIVRRRFVEAEQRWESSLEVIPWGETPAATLRAAATYVLPERPKHGGSREAADARWGRCDNHDNREVRVKGYCPDCGKVVGERVMRLAEFDALNVQLEHSGERETNVSNVVSIDVQLEHSDPPLMAPLFPPELAGSPDVCDTHGRYLTAQERRTSCSWCKDGPPAAPVAPQPRSKRWQCRCGSLEGHSVRSGLGWRCDGCGKETGSVAAVAGGEE